MKKKHPEMREEVVVFRTATGQTGLDAYQFEAAQIANLQRDLDERFRTLVRIIHREQTTLFTGRTDYLWSGGESAANLRDHLRNKALYPDQS